MESRSTRKEEEDSFRVVLVGIGKDMPQEKEAFCRRIGSRYDMPLSLLEKMVANLPVVLKKNLSKRRSEALAHLITSCGGRVSIEKKAKPSSIPIGLEFEAKDSASLTLESCTVHKTLGGSWSILGRVQNVSSEGLEDTWVLVQLFGEDEELLAFEEVPLALNPLPPGGSAPFRAIFDGHIPLKRATLAFKASSGRPLAAQIRVKQQEWIPVMTVLPPEDETEHRDSDLDAPVLELYIPSHEKDQKRTEHSAPEPVELLSEAIEVPPGVLPPSLPSEVLNPKEEGPEQEFKVEEKTLFGEGRDVEAGREGQVLGDGAPRENGFVPEKNVELSREEDDLVRKGDERRALSQTEEALDNSQGALRSEKGRDSRSEEIVPFPWLDAFREAVRSYYREDRDGFSTWFNDQVKEGLFQGAFHRVLVILAHARFGQSSSGEKALENTKRVCEVMLKRDLPLEEVPPLEGTYFASGETWRNLFFRALPKLREIAEQVLAKKEWGAMELEKLIQLVPQMSLEASQRATRFLSSLMGDEIRIDFTKTSPNIGEGLYRVASRLGIVDPRFDHYRGPRSLGDLKLQAFAKMAFPEDPRSIEEPMTWVGGRGGKDGSCLPTHPRCGSCLFEPFCPRLRMESDPAQKGVFSPDSKGI